MKPLTIKSYGKIVLGPWLGAEVCWLWAGAALFERGQTSQTEAWPRSIDSLSSRFFKEVRNHSIMSSPLRLVSGAASSTCIKHLTGNNKGKLFWGPGSA